MNFYNGVLEPGEYGETENAKIFGLGTQSYTGTSNVYIGGSMLIDSVIKDGKTVKELKGGVYGGAYCPPGSTITHKGTTNVTYSTIVSNTNGEIFGGHLGNVITTEGTKGSTHVKLERGTFKGNVYGGSDNNDVAILDSTNVTLNGATVNGNIYGGSKTAGAVTNANMYFYDGNILNGGSFGSGSGANTTVTNSNIVIDGVRTATIHGGPNGNFGGTTTTSNITLKSGRASGLTVYGGGLNSKVTTSNINVEKSTRYTNQNERYLAATVFGGSRVEIPDGASNSEITEINNASKVPTSNITVNDGGNAGTVIGLANVLTVYGGGKNIGVGKANITVNDFTCL